MNRIRSMATRMAAILIALPFLLMAFGDANACPFCTPANPSLAQQRESAAVVLLAEYLGDVDNTERFTIRQTPKGADKLKSRDTATRDFQPAMRLLPPNTPAGSLWLLFGQHNDALATEFDWTATNVDETSAGYFFRAPSFAKSSLERLPYFVRYLEHPDSFIATDAYAEFAAAPYDEVRQVASSFDMQKVRGWIVDERVPDERKGFYGLVLGIATDPAQREQNSQVLRDVILRQSKIRQSDPSGGDFKPGLDGVLGGYLALEGPAALDFINERFLQEPDAAEGNLRHVVTALRFAHEYLPSVPQQRINASMRLLLPRPGFAPTAITDLARWRDTAGLPEIVELYDRDDEQQRSTRRAIIGYLMTLSASRPDGDRSAEPARLALMQLRARDSSGVADAERYHQQFGGLGAAAAARTP